ncbi:MAG: metal-dependent transcriptional regulator [Clostridia bacterium]|nr:metal-dependent transcriptional regulator [Clostridia bacterium]
MRLQESGEMYLETILSLSRQQNRVRSIDVAEALCVTKPSVSRAVGLLKQGGYLTADRDGFLFLTDNGREVAERTLERHHVLTEFFLSLGVSPEVADSDACKIEHDISDESFEAIKRRVETVKKEV